MLGYSQGGLVALRAAASEGIFDRIAVWAPVLDPLATYRIIFGRETILGAAEKHRNGGSDAVVEGTRLRPGFFFEITEADPIGDASQTASPLMIVTGERDPLVREGDMFAHKVARRRSGETILLHLDAGHDFGALGAPELLSYVTACTASFILGGPR